MSNWRISCSGPTPGRLPDRAARVTTLMGMRTPDVELLWWEGCPSTARALAELHAVLADLGLAGAEVRMREIRTDADADTAGFLGSPTILIDGVDLVAHATGHHDEEEQPGLSCRVYPRRGGGISPTPDPDDLRAALRRAAERVEVSG